MSVSKNCRLLLPRASAPVLMVYMRMKIVVVEKVVKRVLR